MRYLIILFFVLLSSCVAIPDNIDPVNNFRLEKYLGKWYEIARLDHSFERGLSRVTADYSLRSDGGVKVINRGYSAEANSWKEAEGKAYFVKESDIGYLKVSSLAPFTVLTLYVNLTIKIINIPWYLVLIDPTCGFFENAENR